MVRRLCLCDYWWIAKQWCIPRNWLLTTTHGWNLWCGGGLLQEEQMFLPVSMPQWGCVCCMFQSYQNASDLFIHSVGSEWIIFWKSSWEDMDTPNLGNKRSLFRNWDWDTTHSLHEDDPESGEDRGGLHLHLSQCLYFVICFYCRIREQVRWKLNGGGVPQRITYIGHDPARSLCQDGGGGQQYGT